ncbi:MAG: tetratricopeptide repeat protein [Verrucomicrobia bacterium]|nr:tetratricopeptide repeat protein [Verrucomicrobiota bacterium]
MKTLLTQTLVLVAFLLAPGFTLGQDADASAEKSEMLYRRGLAAYKAGDYSSAESFFEQTLETTYSPNAAVYLTYIRKETGDFKGALESLQSYLDQTGDNDPELQSYISLKLFLEARVATQANEKSRTVSTIAIALASLALVVSIISLRKK